MSSTGSQPAAAASPASVTDGQLAAWMAEEYGKNFTAPVEDLLDLDVEEVLIDAACVLDNHRAAHPLRAMAIWPAGPDKMLITADRPGEGRLCVLAVPRRSFGVSMQQALDELLRAARTAAALLDAAGQDSTPPPGRHVPESGTVLAYDAGTVAEGSLDEAVHELFSRQRQRGEQRGAARPDGLPDRRAGPRRRTAGDHPGHAGQALSSQAAGRPGNLLTRPRAPGAGFLSRSTIAVTSGACGPAALRRAGRPWLSPGRRAACHRRRKRAAGDSLRSPGLQGSPPVPCASTEA